MQWLLLAFSFLTMTCATRTAPQQGKINKPVDAAARNGSTHPAIQQAVLLRSAYDSLIKAAAQMEKITGDASLLSKGKRSTAAERALVQDPKAISSDAAQLVQDAYALMGTKPPVSQQKSGDELQAAYHEILAAAEGIELVRRHADTLAPEKVAAFAAQVSKDPEKVEQDVNKLEEDMKEAEEEMEATEKKVEEAKAKEEKTDDKDDVTEAAAANKAAKKALAEADHETHGANEAVGKAEGDKKAEEEAATKKAEAKVEVKEATAEHKEAKAVHDDADKVDDKEEHKVAKLEKKLEKHEEKHEEAKEAHDAHPDADSQWYNQKHKSGVRQLAPYAAILSLAMFI